MDSAIFDRLLAQSRLVVNRTEFRHLRFLHDEIRWDWRLVGIKGARGVGKTTLLLQHLKMAGPAFKGVYFSLDDLHFSTYTLRETVEAFRAGGFTHFYLDEVHKYPNWSREIKNLHDLYRDIRIVFTGSSIIELHKQAVDLSRRAVLYELPGLSFREFLQMSGIASLSPVRLDDVFLRHETVVLDLLKTFRPLEHFNAYLEFGYYPYFLEDKELYDVWLKQVTRLILEIDLSTAEGGRVQHTQKIAQLLQIIADSVPFKPNVQQLASKIQIDRNTLIRYMHHLEKARLIALLYPAGANLSSLQKPEKIFMHNPNLAHTLSANKPETGNLRETFFYNQLSINNQVNYTAIGDFLINQNQIVEVGGPNKNYAQIAKIQNSYLAIDQLELGAGNRIPLWLFGFLY